MIKLAIEGNVHFRLSTIELSKKFNVSEATIRDVVARRSWDYTNL